jgi:hypothetical protein
MIRLPPFRTQRTKTRNVKIENRNSPPSAVAGKYKANKGVQQNIQELGINAA